jgi:hypothetical protein
MPQELLFELKGARVTPHIATFEGTSYQIANIGSVHASEALEYQTATSGTWTVSVAGCQHCIGPNGLRA